MADYCVDGQTSIFDFLFQDMQPTKLKIHNRLRIIEMFAGYGSQAMACDRLGIDFEHYKISEWNISSVNLYKAAHFPDRHIESNLPKEEAIKVLLDYGVSSDGKVPLTEENLKRKPVEWLNKVISNFKETNNIGSICNVKGVDLGITETDKYTYLMTYSFPCQ